ncbi:hypothetical protein L1987_10543 [Smallanthus sonchifolius]|uniref:Uncharacterized protein n=1 Tax=Smallanthus sonchifolius TaxID=185202 RepID=A0ACB9JSD8_9ASTR|nr:hypothetical protein L1987_10543 [Smallanthus sonchifolius]
MAMLMLPRFLVLQVGNKYLSVTENLPASLPSGFVKFDEEQIWSPRVKFAVEQAESGDGRLVHIRSCYNNKYLVTNLIQTNLWLVASAEKPEEDTSKASCTLFEPHAFLGETNVRLRHIHTRNPASYWPSSGGFVPSADTQHGILVSVLSTTGQVFSPNDWERLVILPSQVSFRSEDLDGNYLVSRVIDRWYNYHRFESGMDIGDPLVAHELFPTADGNYRIKNLHFGKFWRRSPNWIWADAQDNNNSNDTLFSFVKISDGVIALRNLGNNNFCGGLTTEGKTNCLNAQYPTIVRQARLMVEERVLQREISDLRYRLSDSRIYQEEILEVSHAFATNDSLDNETTITLSYSSSDSRTTYWNNSVSLTFGVQIEFKTTIIPFISEATVQVSTEFGYAHEWGVEKTTERTREASYTVVVPPSTTIKVSLMCTRAACDVPFSYMQRDLLTNGEWVTTQKDDGIYTGINSYNFYFQSSNVVQDDQGRMYV